MTTSLLSRHAHTTLTEQLAGRFAERIHQRLLAPGSRLPSVRECARRHGVSTHTVVAAYDQLLALGLVEARRQRGFFVRETRQPNTPAVRAEPASPSRPTAPVSATALARGMFQLPGARPMPGLGTLPVEWLDLPMLTKALRRVTGAAQLEALTLRYGEPAGDSRLRQALSVWLAEIGITAPPAQIVTTSGAIQALDLLTRTLLRAGDTVLVDEPGWSVEYARLAALGMRMLSVPRGDEGPDLAAMQRIIEAQQPSERPRLYVTVPVLHNPTGASLSLGHAHRLLQLAQSHDFHIIEDDACGALAAPHLPRLSALDGLQRTAYVSSFSKVLAPQWRVGYFAASPALVERAIDTKLLTNLTTPAVCEQAIAHCLENGLLRRHIERVTHRLDAARTRSVRAAEAAGFRFAAPPRGLFGWVDVGMDTERLSHTMLDDGWFLAPGTLFFATPRPTPLMRINFATTQDPRFWQAVAGAVRGA